MQCQVVEIQDRFHLSFHLTFHQSFQHVKYLQRTLLKVRKFSLTLKIYPYHMLQMILAVTSYRLSIYDLIFLREERMQQKI